MTREDLDALYARLDKRLPVRPEWREGTQAGTRRASLPVTLDGRQTGLTVAVTARLNDKNYLVINLIADRKCVARLCLNGFHRDRATRALIASGHMHRWQDNRPTGSRIAKKPRLDAHTLLPATILTRDSAFDLFLTDCGISPPPWRPMVWPADQVLL